MIDPIVPPHAPRNGCITTGCGPGGINRREFLKAASAVAFTAGFSGAAMAGPFESSDFEHLVPSDKKLQPGWVNSLFDRGEPAVYRGGDLAKIGMPVGGLCAGQVYLGGDGRLWHWDIFNDSSSTGDSHYAHPPVPDYAIDQGFALVRTAERGALHARPLSRAGYADISFRGEYPVGTVTYRDAREPVEVTLEAFSPFIPLNTEDSSLPAVVLEFTLLNTGDTSTTATLAGWLRNPVCSRSRAGLRQNRVERTRGYAMLECYAVPHSETAGEPPRDFGSMVLTLLHGNRETSIEPEIQGAGWTSALPLQPSSDTGHPAPTGLITRTLSLDPGERATLTFVIAWHFPNLRMERLPGGRYYARCFSSAADVSRYIARNRRRLVEETKRWRETWYDSTLPYWFLDRTMANSSILATSTAHRFSNGRFYGWEGVGCCAGTCTHVWHYAHAAARLFPDLERSAREMADFGVSFDPNTGLIDHRGEFRAGYAADGQAGCVLRAYREHQMSADGSFLERNWPSIRKALEYLIAQDSNDDGVLEGSQHNTLDSAWFGPISWISSLYAAALRAGEAMGREVGDHPFADRAGEIASRGGRHIVERLWNGEYFIQRPDPAHPEAMRSGDGCEIDQVFGQSWALQVGLPRILPADKTVSALRSLWTYNFAPDVGPYRDRYPIGRWYAMPGEAGLIMCTFPLGGREGFGGRVGDWAAGYFNECMTGFEYRAAGHMIWEGLVQEGLAVTRAIHDRYHPSRRNPWNEVECGDHYARAMASFGVYLAACGFEYHGPSGHLGFAPRLSPNRFRAAFTAAEGWGAFSQERKDRRQNATIAMKWGRLRLRTVAFELPTAAEPEAVTAHRNGQPIAVSHSREGRRLVVRLHRPITLEAGHQLEISIAGIEG